MKHVFFSSVSFQEYFVIFFLLLLPFYSFAGCCFPCVFGLLVSGCRELWEQVIISDLEAKAAAKNKKSTEIAQRQKSKNVVSHRYYFFRTELPSWHLLIRVDLNGTGQDSYGEIGEIDYLYKM